MQGWGGQVHGLLGFMLWWYAYWGDTSYGSMWLRRYLHLQTVARARPAQDVGFAIEWEFGFEEQIGLWDVVSVLAGRSPVVLASRTSYLATRCVRTVLRACYQLPGTDAAYGGTYQRTRQDGARGCVGGHAGRLFAAGEIKCFQARSQYSVYQGGAVVGLISQRRRVQYCDSVVALGVVLR
eukprot:3206007-Rhodomonas_salina.3